VQVKFGGNYHIIAKDKSKVLAQLDDIADQSELCLVRLCENLDTQDLDEIQVEMAKNMTGLDIKKLHGKILGVALTDEDAQDFLKQLAVDIPSQQCKTQRIAELTQTLKQKFPNWEDFQDQLGAFSASLRVIKSQFTEIQLD